MPIGIILAHTTMFLTGGVAIAFFYARVRASDRAHQGKDVDSDLLDPGFSLLALIFFGVPAIACGTYLHSRGYDESGLLTAGAATLVGLYLGYRRANTKMGNR